MAAPSENTIKTKAVFRLHLNTDPNSLNLWEQRSANSTYLLQQLHASLLKFVSGKLNPQLGSCHTLSPIKIKCLLSDKARWSDGSPILAEDFLRTFKYFLNPTQPGFRADLLFSIKNAKAILKKEKPFSSLGVSAHGKILIFELGKPDLEFIYNLAHLLLSPTPPKENIYSGPYILLGWEKKKKITLAPNPHFLNGHPNRPTVEFYFSSEDSVALSLYEKNEIDYLRRLPTLYIPKFKNRNDFYSIDQFRFDYIAFGPSLKTQFKLRQLLSESLNYEDFQKLFWSKPRPGCLGIPEDWILKTICYSFKPLYQKENDKIQIPHLKYIFSKQGGDDHQRAADWLQAEWKKNLGFQLEVASLENKVFLDEIKNHTPDLFRKGLAPDRATCLSVLENFETNATENYSNYSNPDLDQWIQKMRLKKYSKADCQKGFEILMKDYLLIPTGPIAFSILVKPQWKGWILNELNQLDLSQLHLE